LQGRKGEWWEGKRGFDKCFEGDAQCSLRRLWYCVIEWYV